MSRDCQLIEMRTADWVIEMLGGLGLPSHHDRDEDCRLIEMPVNRARAPGRRDCRRLIETHDEPGLSRVAGESSCSS